MHKLNRLPTVAELINVCWLENCGRIKTWMLSPATLSTAYLVFKTTTGWYVFEFQPIEAVVGLVGGEIHEQIVYLDAERERRQRYQIVPMRVRFSNSGRSSILVFQAPQPQPRENKEQDGLKYPRERVDGWQEKRLSWVCSSMDQEKIMGNLKWAFWRSKVVTGRVASFFKGLR